MLEKAKHQLIEDMKSREIGAIIWSIPDAGFHFIPEIVVTDPRDGSTRVARVSGLYHHNNKLYAIEEGLTNLTVNHFYRHGIDVPPIVVTLTESKADEEIGIPSESKGFTTQGSLEEWAAIADCYFEALREA